MNSPKCRPLLTSKREDGDDIRVNYDNTRAVEQAIERVIELANRALPPNTVFEVRGKMRPDDPIQQDRVQRGHRTRAQLAANWGVAWYWTSPEPNDYVRGLAQEPLFRDDVETAKDGPMGGYIVIARLKTQ